METEKKKSAFAMLMDKMRGDKEEDKPSPEMQKKNLEDLGVDQDEYKKFRKGLMGKG